MRFLNDENEFEKAKCVNGPDCESQIPYRTFEDIPLKFENSGSKKEKSKKYIHTKDLQNMCNVLGLNNCKECKNNKFLQKVLDDDTIKIAVGLILMLLLYKRVFNT